MDLRHQSVCTCISCHHLYCEGCIGGLGYVTQTNQNKFISKKRRMIEVDVITEQVRTDSLISFLM